MSEFDHSHVRLRFLQSTFRTCVLPAALVAVVLRTAMVNLGYLTIPSYLAAIFIVAFAQVMYTERVEAGEARRLGARPIPRVVGKWPGNIDIVFRLFADLKTGYMQDVFLELFEEYQCTTLNLRIFWTNKIISMDQQHMKYIFSTGFEHFSRGNTGKEMLHAFLGNGMLNRDDGIWKAHRALARPFFARDRVSDFDQFEKHTQRVLSILSNKKDGEACDVEDIIGRFTIDAASDFLFGQSLDTLSSDEKGFDAFTHAFNSMQALVLRRNTRQSLWPLLEFFGDACAPHAKTLADWLDPVIKRALEHKKDVKERGLQRLNVQQSTFLEHLADSTEDVDMMRDQLLNILLASRTFTRDTTLALLSFTLYLLALDPERTKKLRREILEAVGTDAIPTADSLQDLKYLRAVLNETLRLFTPLPSNIRETRSEGIVFPHSDPTYISNDFQPRVYMPANTPILTFPFLTHRNPALWGEDAEMFNPERWLDPERVAQFNENPSKFMPFSLGPRSCLGQNYALHEASYFMVRLLQRFETFELAQDKQLTPPWMADPATSAPKPGVHPGTWRKNVEKIWPAYTITIHVKGGLWLRFGKPTD